MKKEVNDEICSKIQLRKRFHYKQLILAGEIKPRDGVLRLIDELAVNNIEQHIVTTSGRQSVEPFLNNSLPSHQKYITNIITYEDVRNHKPYPDAYKLAINLSKKPKENCIAVEDSSIGINAAKAAELNTLLTLPTWHSSSLDINREANACVDSLGTYDKPTNLIYGKGLPNTFVDLSYLNHLIN